METLPVPYTWIVKQYKQSSPGKCKQKCARHHQEPEPFLAFCKHEKNEYETDKDFRIIS